MKQWNSSGTVTRPLFSLLQDGAQLGVELEQSAGQTVANSASLACTATANNVDDDVELALVLSQNQGAVDELNSRPSQGGKILISNIVVFAVT